MMYGHVAVHENFSTNIWRLIIPAWYSTPLKIWSLGVDFYFCIFRAGDEIKMQTVSKSLLHHFPYYTYILEAQTSSIVSIALEILIFVMLVIYSSIVTGLFIITIINKQPDFHSWFVQNHFCVHGNGWKIPYFSTYCFHDENIEPWHTTVTREW